MKALHLTLLALLLSLPAEAAVFRVTKTADTLDTACDRDCSLREAIVAANALPGKDFVLAGPGVYTLTLPGRSEDAGATGDLDVKGSLVLLGAGADRTVLDGGGLDRVLDVHFASHSEESEVHAVTIRNGQATGGDGGGIRAESSARLLVRGSVITGSSTDGYGGGIAADALDLRDSTVSGNQAASWGGGVYAFDRLEMENVTVSGNQAQHGGGLGTGAFITGISQVTVTGNSAEFGGGVAGGGPNHCEVACAPERHFTNSVVAGNSAGHEGIDCDGWGVSSGQNVFGVGEGCSPGPADRAGTAAQPLDARLSPLGDRGGPTPTHGLLPNSPALDLVPAGGPCPSADQRGFPRAVDGDRDAAPECDAGAFEAIPGCEPAPGTLCLGNRFQVSVRWATQGGEGEGQAIPLAADTGAFWFFAPDNLEILVKVLNGCGLNQRFWVFLSGLTDAEVEVTVVDSVTGERWEHHHDGGSALPTRLDTGALAVCAAAGPAAGGTLPAFLPGSVHRVTRTTDGELDFCDRDCSLREAVRAGNHTEGGAAIVIGPGVYTLTREGRGEEQSLTGDLDVQGNLLILGAGAERTLLDGGGIDRVLHVGPLGSLEIQDVTVRNGWARTIASEFASGGGIQAFGPLTVVRSLVTGNRAEDAGGGIDVLGDLTVLDSTISDNTAQAGGGLHHYRRDGPEPAAKLRLTNVTVSGNRAELAGGVSVDHKDTEIDQLTVTGNHATQFWGGFLRNECGCVPEDPDCCGSTHFDLSRSVIAGNTAGRGAPDCDVIANSGGFNVFGIGCHPGPTDLAGTAANPLDPRLSPLGDHGGPTPTHLPLPGSPAIDAIVETCPVPTDQRGAPRPASQEGLTACDAGAVEVGALCIPGPARLCLQGGRFRVTVRWTAQGSSGPGRTVPLTADTGAFWFFDRANLEMTVKVLDGCGLGGHYWVFLSGLTDVGVEVTVEDTVTGNTWTHSHAAGTPLQPRLDTEALNCVNL
jgi:CSLREA domain-containing protein